ncbi:MAG: beta-N-acetylhexosaminidase [Planctomycetota bacterium]
MNKPILLPQPRRIDRSAGLAPVATGEPPTVVDPSAVPHAQGYRLTVGADGATITAHDEAGAFYARRTLAQLVAQADAEGTIPAVVIDDWPDFAHRGVMLDISRDKVPTMQTLLDLVDRLASWKINEMQLYTEHTFAYAGHEVVWRDASPMTPDEVRRLDAHCRRRHVELVANQNSFGHMHRWLRHERYRPLAEAPDGWVGPGGHRRGPFSLCPIDPRSAELLADLYDQLLANFTSRRFNVGCDETWDLGHGRSKDECRRRGRGRVYLDFLRTIHELVTARGRTMMFWGDIILQHPELIGELPRDAVALEWGYEADHPFDAHAEKFAQAGLSFYVCPGTSAWNSIVGRTDNAIANIRSAVEHGLARGAVGCLTTDWGDNGHLQPLPVSYQGYACAAAMSWCADANRDLDLPGALDRFAFADEAGAMGTLACQLGNVHETMGAPRRNQSAIFTALQQTDRPIAGSVYAELRRDRLDATRDEIGRITAALSRQRMARDDAALIVEEYEYAAGLLRLALDAAEAKLASGADDLSALPERTRRKLAEQLEASLAAHRSVWLARNRPGGMTDSADKLRRHLGGLGVS